VAAGGRYDALYAHFGSERPALGCAIDLDKLGWALGRGRAQSERVRVLVHGGDSSWLAALRAAEFPAAPAPERDVLDYARVWQYSHVLTVAPSQASLTETSSGDNTELPADVDQVVARLKGVR
jgi:histidyl-tRNA synthetase